MPPPARQRIVGDTLRPVKKDLAVALAAILVVAALAFGLAKMRPDLPMTPSAPYVAGAKGSSVSAAAKAKAGKVVMRVNGEPVTEGEFNAFMDALPEQQRAMFAGPNGRRQLADELVRMKSLEQEAHRLGVMNDPQVAAQLELLRTQVTATQALQKLVQQKSEPQIRAMYEREKKNAMSLRHIVIAYAGGMIPPRNQGQPPTEAAAAQKAIGIIGRIRAGADFAEVAKTESDDIQSAPRGGSLGPMQPGALPPEISGVVSKLQPGQVSEPVKTQFGIHIFNVAEPSLDELRPMLAQQVQQEIAQQEVGRLQKAAKVDLDPTFFPPATAAPPAQLPPPRGQS